MYPKIAERIAYKTLVSCVSFSLRFQLKYDAPTATIKLIIDEVEDDATA